MIMRLNPGGLTRLTWLKWWGVMLMVLLASGCATTPPFDGRVEILTTSQEKPLTGADCVVTTDAGSWTVQTPGHATVGDPNGDLRVVCNKAGYRTSEVIHRSRAGRGLNASGTPRVGVGVGGGFGGYSGVGVSLGFGFPLTGTASDYPSQITVDMAPQQ
jgi:hypothetical protein